mgnify:CR=1 FL=1
MTQTGCGGSDLTQHDPAEPGAVFQGETLFSRPGAPHDMHHTLDAQIGFRVSYDDSLLLDSRSPSLWCLDRHLISRREIFAGRQRHSSARGI